MYVIQSGKFLIFGLQQLTFAIRSVRGISSDILYLMIGERFYEEVSANLRYYPNLDNNQFLIGVN